MNAWTSLINERPALVYRPDEFAAAFATLLPDTALPANPGLIAEAVLVALSGLPDNVDALADGVCRLVAPDLFGAADTHVLPARPAIRQNPVLDPLAPALVGLVWTRWFALTGRRWRTI